MELKDMILSTLAELEDVNEENKVEEKEVEKVEEVKEEKTFEPLIKEVEEEKEEIIESTEEEALPITRSALEDERHFCESMRERVLVLFEGFQSPNNKSIEAKVDLTLNFLEYLLAVVDERLESLDKKEK